MNVFVRIKLFFVEVKSEFSRISWPDRPTTGKFTLYVCIISLVAAIYLGLLDLGLAQGVQYIIQNLT